MTRGLLFFVVFCGCSEENNCYKNAYRDITNLPVSPDKKTPSGIRVDTGGHDVNLAELDRRIANIEKCILDTAKEYGFATRTEMADWQCLSNDFTMIEELRRECLIIKIVAPVLSKCSNWQFIGIKAPDELCLAKGVTPTPECPCMWRSAIQNENVIVTPPALYLWDIGRIMTSCNNVWFSLFAKCLDY